MSAPTWLPAFITEVLIPEIAAIFRARHAANLPPPTNEEIVAALNLTTDQIIARGAAWDAANPEPDGPTEP